MQPPSPSFRLLQPESWQKVLAESCARLIQEKKQVVLCITGKSGSGKSTLGKQIRKKGLPGIPARKIGVIDDGVLAVPLLGIFTRRIKSKTRERDDLAPFAHFLKNKKLVVYVNSKPELRLGRCDVVLRLQLPEEERQRRLIQRDHDGAERFQRTLNASNEVGIPADHVFDLCLVASHDRRLPDKPAGTVSDAAVS
jgi:hypothetical protein